MYFAQPSFCIFEWCEKVYFLMVFDTCLCKSKLQKLLLTKICFCFKLVCISLCSTIGVILRKMLQLISAKLSQEQGHLIAAKRWRRRYAKRRWRLYAKRRRRRYAKRRAAAHRRRCTISFTQSVNEILGGRAAQGQLRSI